MVFAFPYLMPSPLISLYESWPTSPQQRIRLTQEYGLDRALPLQYTRWLQRLVTGTWGTSRYSQRSVCQDSWYALGHTLLLIAWVVVLCSLRLTFRRQRRRSPSGQPSPFLAPTLSAFLGALPGFIVAIVVRELIIWQFGWISFANLPLAEPYYFLHPFYMFLPAAILALPPLYAWHWITSQVPFPHTHSLGETMRRFGTGFRPYLELFFLEVCLVEYVFAFPGLGTLGIEALKRRDIPLLQGFILCMGLLYMVACCLCEWRTTGDTASPHRARGVPSTTASPLAAGVGAASNLWRLCLLGGLTVGAPWLLWHDPMTMHTHDQFLAPGYRYLFGTDFLGRDVMSRTLKGFQSAIPHVVSLAVLLGGLNWFLLSSTRGIRGLIARVWISSLLCLQAVPSFILAFVGFLIFENRVWTLEIALALACAPMATRLMADGVTLRHRVCQFALLSERLLLFEVIFYFLNLSTESFSPTWGGDIRHGMRYGHINIWMLVLPALAVVWSRYIFSRLGGGLSPWASVGPQDPTMMPSYTVEPAIRSQPLQ